MSLSTFSASTFFAFSSSIYFYLFSAKPDEGAPSLKALAGACRSSTLAGLASALAGYASGYFTGGASTFF